VPQQHFHQSRAEAPKTKLSTTSTVISVPCAAK
jgi:hypothetical protein